jgi:hypothetical protein
MQNQSTTMKVDYHQVCYGKRPRGREIKVNGRSSFPHPVRFVYFNDALLGLKKKKTTKNQLLRECNFRFLIHGVVLSSLLSYILLLLLLH